MTGRERFVKIARFELAGELLGCRIINISL